MLLWDAFAHGPRPATFDLVSHDLGSMATRRELLPAVLTLAGAEGIVVLDDLHKEEYWPWVDLALTADRWRYVDTRQATLDHFGRYCGLAVPAGHPLLRR